MQKRKIIIAMLLMACLVAVSSVSAVDSNATCDSQAIFEDGADNITSEVQDDSLKSSKTIYFDASTGSDGDGSQSNPYKYVKSDRLSSSGDLTAYFADGTYDITSNILIKSNAVLIGQSSENTVFNSKSNANTFEVNQGFSLKMSNLSCKKMVIVNHGTLEAKGIIFEGKNNPSANGGIIISNSAKALNAHVYLSNCIFKNSLAFTGGSIYLVNSTLSVENSSFSNSRAKKLGGAIYAVNSTLSISCSDFISSNASYGGVAYLEKSDAELRNVKMYNSTSYSFGGAVASKYSNIEVEECLFSDYSSSDDAGGAFYNFKGDLTIKTSSFINGFSQFGGALCSLDSKLSVLSSRFFNNTARHYGGVIYSLYGSLNVNDSFFNRSHAFEGAVIESAMTSDLTFTNNIFLNSTASNGGAIGLDCDPGDIVEYGNHFEDIYHVFIEYDTYFDDDEFVMKSDVIDYIASSTGKYLGTYDAPEIGDRSDFVTINMTSIDYPNNTTILLNTDNECKFSLEYHIRKFVDLSDKRVYINIYADNDYGNTIKHYEYDVTTVYLPSGNFTFYHDFAFTKFTHRFDAGSEKYPVSMLDSVASHSTYVPSSYDGRDYGYLTSVKDQADGGNCWAFSGIATLEACIKKITGIEYDFSEENAKNLMASFSTLGLDIDTNDGGYDSMIMGYLTSWFGPVPEKVEPYDDLSSLSSVYGADYYVQNIRFLYDSNLIKKAIMDYGAVSATFAWLDEGYHAVSLIGWDDNYKNYDSLGHYTQGAWIFKNSWGTDWGDDGFGYLSYDSGLVTNRFRPYTFTFNKSDIFMHCLQYDYSGANNFIVQNGHVFYKNVFKCTRNVEWVRAFSTYFLYPTNYKVSIYNNGELHSTQSGYSDAGYYTIALNKRLILFKSDELAIVVELCNEGKNYVPVCRADKLTAASFQDNCSFISYNGVKWFDMHDLDYPTYLIGPSLAHACQVACIKAFTFDYFSYKEMNPVISQFESVEAGQEILINVTFSREDYNFDSIERTNESLVEFNINGKTYYAEIINGRACLKIAFDKVGQYVLKANYINNLFESEEMAFNFTVHKKATELSANSLSKVYGGSEKSVVTLKDSNGKPITGALISFDIGGNPAKASTNSKGQASLNINIVPKTYIATVKYAGSGTYAGSTAKMKIVIKKANLKITASKMSFKRKVKSKKYTVTLKSAQKKAVKGLKVTISINGKTYSAKTNAKGQATFKITKLTKKGNHKATIRFKGDAYYNGATKRVTISVK